MPLSNGKSPVEQIDSGLHLLDALRHAFVTFRDLPAVVDADNVTSFGELYEMAQRFSADLDNAQQPVSQVIGVASRPNAQSISTLLGIIFSGRAYLPIDPQAPESVRKKMTEESRAEVEGVNSGKIAAVLYTSATTGAAKGVKHSHRCLLFHSLTYAQMMQIQPGDRVSLFASLNVGASVSNLFGALLAGATVYPMSFSMMGAGGIIAYLINHKLTVLHMVPSLFRLLAQSVEAANAFSSVHHLKLGGEPVTGRDVRLFAALNIPGAHLMNGLGITEAGGNVTFGEIADDSMVSIGKAVDGISAEIQTAEDDVGELIVRSRFLTAGYVGESAEWPFTFFPDGSVTLRTGDIVRRNPNGTWLHLGRMDEVVKINGNRVALPEVAAALRDFSGVEDAAAVVVPDGENQPVLCGVLSGTKAPPVSALREHMKVRLSSVTIPARFYHVASLPRGSGGKINRPALGDMVSRAAPLRDHLPRFPSGALEAHLLAIWKAVLHVDNIGVDDSFFDVGGDSLKAVDLLTSLHRQLHIHVNIEQLYRHETIAKLAASISDSSWRESDFPAVVLRSGNHQETVFVIPGAGSDVVALCDLAQALPNNLHVIGLQYSGLDGKTPYMKSVGEIASHFIHHIKTIQSAGPYRVIGTSFGGMVAFEVARQLETEGDTISFLGLIDTYAPRYLTLKSDLSLSAKIRAFAYWSLPIGQKQGWSFKQAMRGVREKCILGKARIGLNVPRPYKHRFYYLMEACFKAGERYVIQPIRTPVTVFRVEQQLPPELFEQNDTLGWGNSSISGVKSILIPGVHGAHIRPPHVFQLAKKIAKEMPEAG